MPRKLSAKVKRERAAARKAARELEDERKARRTDGVEDICNGIAQPITCFFLSVLVDRFLSISFCRSVFWGDLFLDFWIVACRTILSLFVVGF